ncbi:sphingomyelin synthase-related protein 1-like [Amphibalanus amphitrite]|uniref:sphingomyelin synthase-related protein 1-like n=1 Tax=Amphibalanus amphitrite TaxID=1232801 RepID=UPI001C917B7E|nr:sphingomyelin synthase-related protein 1-like [Amphibalanus amphitrite]XP_043247533.1 sphingomyelin synthase-related protein 1-like [Amphibalanus amphitrite]
MSDSVEEWDVERVRQWLHEHGFSSYTNLLCDPHRLDGSCLLMLTEQDLKQPPLEIKVLGDVKRLWLRLCELQGAGSRPSAVLGSPRKQRRIAAVESSDTDAVEEVPERERALLGYATSLRPERFKAVLSMLYLLLVTWITSFVMVIVHDRVPDMKRYPPLPDIFLDNIPHIPWAFSICELIGTTLLVIWISVLLVHKHRFILIRRFNSLCGTVYLLRCVTMLITSLSVPGAHLSCAPREYGDIYAKLYQAYSIWHNAGLSIQGVRSCGDYMFSGHTVALTMLNFFITEYTPRRIYFLHTFTWLLNVFGVFFILSAHEHYSIDVFIAFYITSRLFMYYHTLANNQVKRKRADEKRTRIWFPMFSYFEANVHGTVPNEFEWPVTREWLASMASAAMEKARHLGVLGGGGKLSVGGGREMNGGGVRNGVRKHRHRR